jgi:DNA mismatch repair protein MutS2
LSIRPQLGQILVGEDLRDIAVVLESVKASFGFATDFAGQCSTLRKFKARLYPMPQVLIQIRRAVDTDGSLKDDASDELQKIRRQKLTLRKKIEDQLVQVLHKSDIEGYIEFLLDAT